MRFGAFLLRILAFSLFVTTVATKTNAANDPTPCSLATLNGAYGVIEQGSIVAQLSGFPPPPFPVALAAIATYDGAGNESGTFKLSLGGLPVSGTFVGTYTVNSDCTYTETFIATPPGIAPLHVSGIITGDGTFREIHYIYTDFGRVVSGIAGKIPPGGCSLETVKGNYVVFGEGTIRAQFPGFPPPPFLVAHVGPFTADGAGQFSGSEDLTVSGITSHPTFTGTYSINSDCTLSVVISESNGDVVHEWGTITGEGRSQEFHGIAINPGWVFAESAKKQ